MPAGTKSMVSRRSTVADTPMATSAPSSPMMIGLTCVTMPVATVSTSVEIRSVTSPALRSVKKLIGSASVWCTIAARSHTATRVAMRAISTSDADHVSVPDTASPSAIQAVERTSRPASSPSTTSPPRRTDHEDTAADATMHAIANPINGRDGRSAPWNVPHRIRRV